MMTFVLLGHGLPQRGYFFFEVWGVLGFGFSAFRGRDDIRFASTHGITDRTRTLGFTLTFALHEHMGCWIHDTGF